MRRRGSLNRLAISTSTVVNGTVRCQIRMCRPNASRVRRPCHHKYASRGQAVQRAHGKTSTSFQLFARILRKEIQIVLSRFDRNGLYRAALRDR